MSAPDFNPHSVDTRHVIQTESRALPDDRLRVISELHSVLSAYGQRRLEDGQFPDEVEVATERALSSDLDLVFALDLLIPSLSWLEKYASVLPHLVAWRAFSFENARLASLIAESTQAEAS